MGRDIDFQEALDMVRKWDNVHQDQFYELFPKTVQQETQYDLIGFQQHDEEDEFAPDLEEDLEEKDERHLRKQLQSQLAHLSGTAGREAASAQNLTVYNHAMTIWNQAEDTGELLEYLEAYAEERTDGAKEGIKKKQMKTCSRSQDSTTETQKTRSTWRKF